VKTLLRSFAGGVITPEMFGRLDLVKFQTGLALARNFWTLPHGPVQNRPGTEYVLEVKDSTRKTRVIRFEFSTEQAYALEFGHLYMRVHTAGATLLDSPGAITAATNANPGVFTRVGHGFTSGRWVYFAGAGGMTEVNGRFFKVVAIDPDTFSLQALDGTTIDTSAWGTYTSGGTVSRVFEIATPYVEADLFDLHYTQSADVMTIVHEGYAPREVRRTGPSTFTLTTIAFNPALAAPASITATAEGPGGGSLVDEFYKATAVTADGLEESLASPASLAVSIDLTVVGNYGEVTPAAVVGAARYNIYKRLNGLFGYIGQSDGSAFKDTNITPDMGQTPPESDTPFATDFPRAVDYYEQRRCFGGTALKPQNFLSTRSATESNVTYSIPTRDDDRIAFRIAAKKAQTIRHIVGLNDLLLLTSGGVWKVTPQNSDVLTPTTAAPKLQSYDGASNVQPMVTGNSVLYAAARGGRLRDVQYDNVTQAGYKSADLSVMAPHLFDGYTITDMAYRQAPHSMLFATRSDGCMLGLTYMPDQQVIAWHEHCTDGQFESLCAIPEGSEDAVYCVVKRTVDGRDVRYVERLHTRRVPSLAEAFFVDCGLTYNGAQTTTIGGLWHLEGKEVAVLGDGAVRPRATVVDGQITLEFPASIVQVGIPIVADMQTLPLALELPAGGQGSPRNVNEVHMRVDESSGVFAGPNFDTLTEYKQRTTEPYGSPPNLVSDFIDIIVEPEWNDGGQLCVRQSDPLPLTIASMVLDAASGG
jgi:hypothetical protein